MCIDQPIHRLGTYRDDKTKEQDVPRLSPRHAWRSLPPFGRLRSVFRSSIAGRVSLFAGLSLFTIMAASASAALFAYETRQDLDVLTRAVTTNATANRLHSVLDRDRHIVDALLKGTDADGLARARHAVTKLTEEVRDCLAGGSGCARPHGSLADTIDSDVRQVLIATEDVLRHAGTQDEQFKTASVRFSTAVDQLHQSLGAWQQRQFEDLARRLRELSARADGVAVYIAGSMAALLLVGLLGFALVLRTLCRLGRLTGGMQRLARGDTGFEIPLRDARDEVGRLARALEVFRQTALRLAASEAELRAVNARLDVALNNMSQGLCMFDAEDRLIVSNQRTAQIFGLPADAPLGGRTFDEIVDIMVTRGNMTRENAGGIKLRTHTNVARGVPVSYIRRLEDGRSLAISVTPLPDGGWVGTYEDITERQEAEARIAYMAHHDALTGLANRVLFQAELEKAVAAARRGRGGALLYVDLDRFKEVNDTLGHSAGDTLLRMVAARLRETTRETDLVARLGGDEFAVIQTAVECPADAARLAERIIAALSEPMDLAEHRIVVGASIGIAHIPADGSEPEELMRKADLALYQAKADGRGVHRCFEPGMSARLQARHALERDLRDALASQEFELHYEAQVALATCRLVGFEALLRWRRPGHGLVPPAEFIPLAEETGLIVPIGEWVIRRACADAASWPEHLSVAVNLSAAQFKTDGLVQVVRAALEASGLAPHRLEIEITESAMLQQSETTLRMLHELRALGVRIVMDDFGTGYSSLSYLQRFPFDRIKIDRSFVRRLGGAEGSEAIIRAVTGLGASLGIETVAEGIETEAQCEQVRAEGCALGQGHLFSRPLPATELPALLRSIPDHFDAKAACRVRPQSEAALCS
jgi:diguanylate cyclase (GGDEF)-like protein